MIQQIGWSDFRPGKTYDGATHPISCTCTWCNPRPTNVQEDTMSTTIAYHMISGGFTTEDQTIAMIHDRQVATITRHKRGYNVRFPDIAYPFWRPSQRQARQLIKSYAEARKLTNVA